MTSFICNSLGEKVGPVLPPPVFEEPGVGFEVAIQSAYGSDESCSRLTPDELEFHVASSIQFPEPS